MGRLTRGVVVVVLLLAIAGCGGQSQGAEGSARSATDSAYAFLDGYVDPDGRVVRRDQGGDTVSEGQAYGLLAAAAVGDQKRFDAIWGWTRKNLQRPDGLLAFQWAGGKVTGSQPASDADLDAARALLVGACRFHRADLRKQAVRIGTGVLKKEVAGSVLVAGPWAAKPPLTFNPSYYAPVTLAALARASGDKRFTQVSAATQRAVAQVMAPLAPDWAVVDPSGGAHAVDHPGGSGAGESTFDAPRTLIRLAEGGSPQAGALAAKAWPALAGNPGLVQRGLNGSPAGGTQAPVALAGSAAAADAAGKRRRAAALLQQARQMQHAHPTYYGAGVVALASLLLETKLLQPSC